GALLAWWKDLFRLTQRFDWLWYRIGERVRVYRLGHYAILCVRLKGFVVEWDECGDCNTGGKTVLREFLYFVTVPLTVNCQGSFLAFPSRRRTGKRALKRRAKPRPGPTVRRFRYLSTQTRKRASRHNSRCSLKKGARKRTDDPQPQRTEPDHGRRWPGRRLGSQAAASEKGGCSRHRSFN